MTRNNLVLEVLVLSIFLLLIVGCNSPRDFFPSAVASPQEIRLIFLHHSTGQAIWDGGVPDWFDRYNSEKGTQYIIEPLEFPKDSPYGWSNYPYDYWNIWVDHAGGSPYMDEPTLEMLTRDYQVIIWKHCFPVSDIEEDSEEGDVASDVKSLENYRLQYQALKEKMHEFPDTLFIVWTGAAQVKGATSKEQAQRARQFFTWVREEWDQPGDNIFLWDFHQLETEGGLYLKDRYASSGDDSHPNSEFAQRVAPLFGQRVMDVIEGRGDEGSLTGE